MTLTPQRIGDRGQRYEVRYKKHDDKDNRTYKFGWCVRRDSAEEMVAAWKQNPEVSECWVVDRRPDSGPDPMDPAQLGAMLQEQLTAALVGKPFGQPLMDEVNKLVRDFCKEHLDFPKLDVVVLGAGHIQLFNQFENWSDVYNACHMCKMQYPGNDEVIDKSFKPYFNRFPMAEPGHA